MSIDEFIPSLWSGRLLANLNNAHVAKSCCNTDYEGEISNFGDSVRISSIGRITIRDFTKNSDITGPEVVDGAQQALLIDQAKYYNFQVDDVDKAQQKPKVMDAAMKEASWGLSDTMDKFLFTTMWEGVSTAAPDNQLDAGSLAAAGLYTTLTNLAKLLDETNTPSGDRFAIISPAMLKLLRDDDRFASFGTDTNRSVIRGETLGKIADFDIKISNNVPDGDDSDYDSLTGIGGVAGHQGIIAGYKGAITCAEQVVKTEAYSPEARFADAMKGLHVYGAKVTRPENVATVFFDYS